MRQDKLIENIKMILAVTGILIFFILAIPYILMGGSINDFLGAGSNLSENSNGYGNNSNKNIVIKIDGKDEAKVYRTSTGKVEKIPVEEYVLGVVWSEMPVDFNEEALKAQAIAARTFYYSKRIDKCSDAKGADICDGVHCQAYMSKKERLDKWDSNIRNKNYEKVKKVVNETKGMVLTYDGELVKYPQYFSTSSGKTENSEDVFTSKLPYLISVSSPGEEVSPRYENEKTLSNSEFISIAKSKFGVQGLTNSNLKEKIEIKSRTDGGSVKTIKIGNKEIDGVDFRKAFDLKSANFQIEFSKNSLTIKSKGYGHGVGMSQWGANLMGKDGFSYSEILKHYYSGVEIGKISYK